MKNIAARIPALKIYVVPLWLRSLKKTALVFTNEKDTMPLIYNS